MDLARTIQELRSEKEKLNRVIASIEELEVITANVAALEKPRRGRKSMSPAERKEASTRMKKYWARKRKQAQVGRKNRPSLTSV